MIRAYLIVSFCSLALFYLFTVAALWQVYELTASVASVGLLSLFQFLPALALYPVVGQTADRFSKHRILQVTALVALLLSLVLSGIAFRNALHVYMLYAAVAVISALRSFEATALAAWLPEWVPPGELSRVLALVSGIKQVARIGGPLLAGALLLVHPQGLAVYSLMAALSVVSFVALLTLHVEKRATAPSRATTWSETFGGLSYVFGNQILLGALLIDLVAGLFGGFTALLPVFAKEVLHTDAAGAGTLRSMVALGALTGSVWIATVQLRNRIGRMLILSVGLVGIVTLVLAFTKNFPMACVAIAVFGALDSFSVNIRQTLIQVATPMELRGRVSATSQLFILISNQLGEFRAGMMGAAFGALPSIAIGGACTLLAALTWGRLFPKLTALATFEEAGESI